MQHRSARFALSATLLAPLLAPLAGCGPADETPAPTSCPVATTVVEHAQTISQSERWAATSTHVVRGDVALAAGVTLTIDPCARVTFAQGASLTAAREGARIMAEGTAAQPISFDGVDDARWSQLAIEHPASAVIRHARFGHGGGDRFHGYATIALRGDGATPAKPVATLDHVTVESSLGPGVRVERAGTFGAGSAELVVRGCGSSDAPYPVVIGEHAMDALPTGAYTGNRADEVLVRPEGANARGGLQQDATLRDRGVPYHIGESAVDRFSIGAGGSDAPRRTTLTIEAGVVLRFHPGTAMQIERGTGDYPASGVLRALGTAARPVVMTSGAETPRAGDWVGLWFGGVPAAENLLEHVTLAYTGHDCGCVLSTCSDITRNDAAVIFTAPPPAMFLRDVRMIHGSGHGVHRGWRGDATPDFMQGNTFEDLAGCAQTVPFLPAGCGGVRACR